MSGKRGESGGRIKLWEEEGARKIGQKKIDPKEKANGVESERSGLFRTKGTDAAARLYERRLKRVVKVRGGRATRDEAEVERRRG